MRSGILLETDEVRAIIAEHYAVPIDNVIRSKYSYMVLDVKAREILRDECMLSGGDNNGQM